MSKRTISRARGRKGRVAVLTGVSGSGKTRSQPDAGGDRVTARRGSRAARWIDVSVPLRTGMVHWPGDPGIRIERVKELSRSDDCTLSALSMGAHSGTHMDAPSHFLDGAPDLDSLSLEASVGPARVLPTGFRPERGSPG